VDDLDVLARTHLELGAAATMSIFVPTAQLPAARATARFASPSAPKKRAPRQNIYEDATLV
jgi:hypothetical protein